MSDYTPAIEFALAVTVVLYLAVHVAGSLTRGRSRRTREAMQAVTGVGVGIAALVTVALLVANQPGQTAAALDVASPGQAESVPWPAASGDGSTTAGGLTPELAQMLQNALGAAGLTSDQPIALTPPATGGGDPQQSPHPGPGAPPIVTSPAPPPPHTTPPTTVPPTTNPPTTNPPTTNPPTTDPPTTNPPTTDPPTTDPPTTDPPSPTDPPSSP